MDVTDVSLVQTFKTCVCVCVCVCEGAGAVEQKKLIFS